MNILTKLDSVKAICSLLQQYNTATDYITARLDDSIRSMGDAFWQVLTDTVLDSEQDDLKDTIGCQILDHWPEGLKFNENSVLESLAKNAYYYQLRRFRPKIFQKVEAFLIANLADPDSSNRVRADLGLHDHARLLREGDSRGNEAVLYRIYPSPGGGGHSNKGRNPIFPQMHQMALSYCKINASESLLSIVEGSKDIYSPKHSLKVWDVTKTRIREISRSTMKEAALAAGMFSKDDEEFLPISFFQPYWQAALGTFVRDDFFSRILGTKNATLLCSLAHRFTVEQDPKAFCAEFPELEPLKKLYEPDTLRELETKALASDAQKEQYAKPYHWRQLSAHKMYKILTNQSL